MVVEGVSSLLGRVGGRHVSETRNEKGARKTPGGRGRREKRVTTARLHKFRLQKEENEARIGQETSLGQTHAIHVIAEGRGMHGREWCRANVPTADGPKYLAMPHATNGMKLSIHAKIYMVKERIVVGCNCALAAACADPFFPQQPTHILKVTDGGPQQGERPWYSFENKDRGISDSCTTRFTGAGNFLTKMLARILTGSVAIIRQQCMAYSQNKNKLTKVLQNTQDSLEGLDRTNRS